MKQLLKDLNIAPNKIKVVRDYRNWGGYLYELDNVWNSGVVEYAFYKEISENGQILVDLISSFLKCHGIHLTALYEAIDAGDIEVV